MDRRDGCTGKPSKMLLAILICTIGMTSCETVKVEVDNCLPLAMMTQTQITLAQTSLLDGGEARVEKTVCNDPTRVARVVDTWPGNQENKKSSPMVSDGNAR